jgi:hypothetical protein
MDVVVANLSSQIADAQLAAVIAAINRQVAEHYQPEWRQSATVTGYRLDLKGAKANLDGRADAVIYVGDQSQDPTVGVGQVFGYHSENYNHVPYGFVYGDVCEKLFEKYKLPWTAALSHEVLELLSDPKVSFLVTGPAPAGGAGSANYALEVCDPTQGDTYKIDGIDVSNFVSKKYFNQPGGTIQSTNYLNLALAPFGVRPLGNYVYQDADGTHEIWGARVTPAMQDARKLLGKWRRNVRRRDQLSSEPPLT